MNRCEDHEYGEQCRSAQAGTDQSFATMRRRTPVDPFETDPSAHHRDQTCRDRDEVADIDAVGEKVELVRALRIDPQLAR